MSKLRFAVLNFVFIFILNNNSVAAEKGGMPQLNPEFWFSQVFWLTVSFGLMYLILSKIVLPKISQNLESRKEQIQNNIEIADNQRKESEKKLAEFDEIIKKSRIEANVHLSEIRQKLNLEINKKKEEIDKQIKLEIENAEKEILNLKKNSSNKINQIAKEISIELVKQVLNIEPNNSSVSAIVDDLSKKNRNKYYGN